MIGARAQQTELHLSSPSRRQPRNFPARRLRLHLPARRPRLQRNVLEGQHQNELVSLRKPCGTCPVVRMMRTMSVLLPLTMLRIRFSAKVRPRRSPRISHRCSCTPASWSLPSWSVASGGRERCWILYMHSGQSVSHGSCGHPIRQCTLASAREQICWPSRLLALPHPTAAFDFIGFLGSGE